MLQTPLELMQKIGLSEAIIKDMQPYLQTHTAAIAIEAEQSYKGELPCFGICSYRSYIRLAVLCQLLPNLLQRYLSLGILDHNILATLQDIALRATLYQQAHHCIGLSKDDAIWFRHLMNTQIFKIGALQFQQFPMVYLDEAFLGFPYMKFAEQQKLHLPQGTAVINVPIYKPMLT